MKSSFRLLSLVLTLGTTVASQAGTPSEKNPVADPVAISPTVSPWETTLNLYGWLPGIDAQLGVNGYHADSSFGIGDILSNLDMTVMFNLEVRKGRWGGWIDGIYLKVSSDADASGPLLDSLGVSIETVIAEAALFYRVWENDRGFLDLYGGARYLKMSSDLSLTVSDAGIREVSQQLSAQVFETLRSGAASTGQKAKNEAVAKAQQELAAIVGAKQQQVQSSLNQLRAIADTHPGLVKILQNSRRIQEAFREVLNSKIVQASAAAQELSSAATAARQAAAAARARAERALSNAEKQLAKAIERELRASIPSQIAGSADWVDPFFGFRARYNLIDRLYAVAKSDIGGFGVGSEFAWQAYGAVGYQVNQRIATELGYRYFSVDYEGSRGLNADLQIGGVVLSLLIRF